MTSPDKQKLRERVGPAVDPANTDAPGIQNNKNGPPGPGGNKKGPPTSPPTTTTEVLATSTQTPPLETTTSVSATQSPSFSPSLASSPSTPSPISLPSPATSSTADISPSLMSSATTSTSIALAPSIYYETSPATSTFTLPRTTLSTGLTSISTAASRPTGLVPPPPHSVVEYRHGTLGPGQKGGIALGTIAGSALVLALIFLFFKWSNGQNRKALPRLHLFTPGRVALWPSRSRIPAEMSDSFLTAEAGSRSSVGWDYRSTFAQPTVREKSRRSLSRSLRKLVRLNPLGQNPVTPSAPGEGSSSRNSFASFFRRRSTTSTSSSFIDVESPPPLPPLPAMFQAPRPSASLSPESGQSDTAGFLRPPTIPAEVLPPAFHRSWCYRNSQISLASENSDARSFQSVPGWVKFHYPHRTRNERLVSQVSGPALVAPQAVSPGSWLKAKILRRSQSTVASEEKGGFNSDSDCSNKSASTESLAIGPSGSKQTQLGDPRGYESSDSLVQEKQDPWEI